MLSKVVNTVDTGSLKGVLAVDVSTLSLLRFGRLPARGSHDCTVRPANERIDRAGTLSHHHNLVKHSSRTDRECCGGQCRKIRFVMDTFTIREGFDKSLQRDFVTHFSTFLCGYHYTIIYPDSCVMSIGARKIIHCAKSL